MVDIVDPFDKPQSPQPSGEPKGIVDPFATGAGRDINTEFPEYHEPSFGQKAKAFGYGAVTGLAGGLGELEDLGIKGSQFLPEFARIPESEGRAFHNVQDIKKSLERNFGIKPPEESVSGYETAGELLGGFGTSLPSLARKVLGSTTRTGEFAAKQAEKMGFKLSPTQVRADAPLAEKGATGWAEHNQTLANKLASKGTGVEVSEISPEFIKGRYRKLGEEFDNLYEGKVFNIDKNAVDAIHQISAMENQLPNMASVSPVKQAADNILTNFQNLTSRQGANPNTFGIQGEALQRLRNALSQRARSSSDQNAHEIYNLIDQIDASIARNHPQIAEKLTVLRPKYRNTVILDDLWRAGGIDKGNVSLNKLGNIIKSRPEGLKSESEIDKLGRLGKELQMKGRWETSGSATDEQKAVDAAIRKITGLTSVPLGLKTRGARVLQKQLNTPTGKKVAGASRMTVPSAVGSAVTPIIGEENEQKE